MKTILLLIALLFAGVTSAQAGNHYGRGNGSLHIRIGGLGFYGCGSYCGYPGYAYGPGLYAVQPELVTQVIYVPQPVVYVQADLATTTPEKPLPLILGPDGTIYKQVRQTDGSIALYPQGNIKTAPAQAK